MELNNLESHILRLLESHQGRDFACSRERLVQKINGPCGVGETATPQGKVNEREIRRVIKHLVESHGQWIGSCSRGYFMIQTDEELLTACKYYHGYALSLLQVEAKLRKTSLATLLGQLSMEFVTQPFRADESGLKP
jgi:hypothetical protein